MNILIVFTHPNHESLNYSFLNSVLDGLNENSTNITTKVLDLYKENFNPVLIFNNDIKRRNMNKVSELKKYREQILWADKIVFIYPIWWGRPPAMLLGYIDRLMTANFAYKNKGLMVEGLFNKKSVVCLSTMKAPSFYPKIILRNAHKNLMKKAVFNFIGIKKIKFFEFGLMESKKNKQRIALAKVKNYFKKIKE
jgi:NAD(P)H dehydrogenase (quinone)